MSLALLLFFLNVKQDFLCMKVNVYLLTKAIYQLLFKTIVLVKLIVIKIKLTIEHV